MALFAPVEVIEAQGRRDPRGGRARVRVTSSISGTASTRTPIPAHARALVDFVHEHSATDPAGSIGMAMARTGVLLHGVRGTRLARRGRRRSARTSWAASRRPSVARARCSAATWPSAGKSPLPRDRRGDRSSKLGEALRRSAGTTCRSRSGCATHPVHRRDGLASSSPTGVDRVVTVSASRRSSPRSQSGAYRDARR